MDQSTSNIRLASWKAIIESCQSRPEGISARQWLSENQIPEKQYYYWQRKVRKLACAEMDNSLPVVSAPGSVVSFAEIPISAKEVCEAEPDPVTELPPAVTIKTRGSTIEISSLISDALMVRLVKEVTHAL
jgi:putative transposase